MSGKSRLYHVSSGYSWLFQFRSG